MTDDAQRQLVLTIAADSKDFLRKECPRCGLEFKLKGETTGQNDELSWWLEETIRGTEDAADQHEEPSGGLARIACPYCADHRPKQEFTHPELLNYIRRIVRREVVEPKLAMMFQAFASGFQASKHLKVKTSEPSGRSPRPVSGPEPDDQVAVRCIGCSGDFKVHEGWRGTVVCPFCSAELLAH